MTRRADLNFFAWANGVLAVGSAACTVVLAAGAVQVGSRWWPGTGVMAACAVVTAWAAVRAAFQWRRAVRR